MGWFDLFRRKTPSLPKCAIVSPGDSPVSHYRHPLLGGLIWDEHRSTLVGVAALKPKHTVPVQIDIPMSGDPDVAQLVKNAGEIFAILREHEWYYRESLARVLIQYAEEDGDLRFAKMSVTEVSRLFVLREVRFLDPRNNGIGGAVLYYDHHTGYPLRPDVGVRIEPSGITSNIHLERPS
jgi:hypothetical protein